MQSCSDPDLDLDWNYFTQVVADGNLVDESDRSAWC